LKKAQEENPELFEDNIDEENKKMTMVRQKTDVKSESQSTW